MPISSRGNGLRRRTSILEVKVALAAILLLLLAACGGEPADNASTQEPADGAEGSEAAAGGEAYDIVLVPGVIGDEFYVSMECGAREAADELGVNLDVQGAEEFDPTLQTPVLEAVIASQPDAILIAPTDVTAMQAPIQQAVDAGITVVLVDTTLDDPSIAVSAIASDNTEGGRMAADALAEQINEQGVVMVINVNPGISTTDQRQQGFEEAIAEYENIEYIGTEFSENEPARAAEIVAATLAAEPELNGIFGTNLFSAEGAATGARNAGPEGENIRIVGFDAGPAQIDQLEQGQVQALIVQKPIDIGRMGVEQAVAALNGEQTEEQITTDFVTATADNLDDPEIEPFLYRSSC
jgi:ribose transport system substrate-binding protein